MNKAIERALESETRAEERAARCKAALAPFAEITTELANAYAYGFGEKVNVELAAKRDDEASALLHEVLRIVGQRKAAKKFNSQTGKVEYTITTPAAVIEIKAVPPRCEVEAYQETEVFPSRTEVVTKFRLKNPEECLGQAAPAGA